MVTTREMVYQALLQQFVPLQQAGTLKTLTRALRAPDDIPATSRPALIVSPGGEETSREVGQPARRTVLAHLWLYVGGSLSNPASGALNALLDTVAAALEPSATDLVGGNQTLGGVVFSAWIEGHTSIWVEYDETLAAALIPVVIVIP